MIFFYIAAIILGASLGSFSAATWDRVKRKESIVYPGSHCTSCQKPLKPWHNIPVLSWLFLGGKCAYCKVEIPISFWIVEILGAIIGIIIAYIILNRN